MTLRRNLRETLLYLRAVHVEKSVQQFEADLARARAGLAKSLAARTAVHAEIAIHEATETAPREVPAFLLRSEA